MLLTCECTRTLYTNDHIAAENEGNSGEEIKKQL